ncbi:MAG: hypothetical protein ABW076_13700 [Candidatus Thiodiazotropha sp.]
MVHITACLLLAVPSIVDAEDLDDLKDKANAVLSLMGYSVFPDVTTSTLSINNANTGNPGFRLSQFYGGFTYSEDIPLYLDGGIAYSQFDPTIVLENEGEQATFEFDWSSLSLSGAIGWDFQIADKLIVRPTFNVMLGTLRSELYITGPIIPWALDEEWGLFDDGKMDVYGVGEALMLDYEDYTEAREIDFEARIGHMYMEGYHASNNDTVGSASVATASLWTRYRSPTGIELMKIPLRYVLEASHTEFIGDQRGILGFDSLSSLGAGFEIDSSHYPVYVTRTRILLRHVFGKHVSGTSLGIALSF